MKKYRNISNGIVIVVGRGHVASQGFIELSEEEINHAEISPYIGAYLVPYELAPVMPTPAPAPKEVVLSSNVIIEQSQGQMTVNPPEVQTEEELVAEKQAEEDEILVPVLTAIQTEDGSGVQSYEEIQQGKVREAIEAIKGSKKKIEYIETITDKVLLSALLPHFKGKTVEMLEEQFKKLS